MDIIVNAPVINPKLYGKAVRLMGFDVHGVEIKGVYIVQRVEGYEIHLVNNRNTVLILPIDNISWEDNPGMVKITVLEGQD